MISLEDKQGMNDRQSNRDSRNSWNRGADVGGFELHHTIAAEYHPRSAQTDGGYEQHICD